LTILRFDFRASTLARQELYQLSYAPQQCPFSCFPFVLLGVRRKVKYFFYSSLFKMEKKKLTVSFVPRKKLISL
jgi:hypothetical protein